MITRILNEKTYDEAIMGGSITGSLVEVIGERTVELDDGRIIEQYLYNIVGYTPENNLPFAALKANIFC